MSKRSHDKDRHRQEQQAPQRIHEQQQHRDRGATNPSQGGQSDTNRVYSDRHPTSGAHTDED